MDQAFDRIDSRVVRLNPSNNRAESRDPSAATGNCRATTKREISVVAFVILQGCKKLLRHRPAGFIIGRGRDR